MQQYLDLLKDVLDNGKLKGDRTGTGTISVFGRQMRFDLRDGFPLVTTKKVHTKSIIHELLWLISGNTNIEYLKQNGVRIWDEWADDNGNLGPVYGHQWRKWGTFEDWDDRLEEVFTVPGIDQLSEVIEQIKKNPDSRRLIVTAWNPSDLPEMALPPCHMFFQFYVNPLEEGETKRRLDLQLYQRSADMFLGVPFNIASYALLLMMVAQVTGTTPGEFIWTGGDCHIYTNHIDQVKLQLTREPYPLPKMIINPLINNIDEFVYQDFRLENYQSHPTIKGQVSV